MSFRERPGPTALRADLVRTLSLSAATVELEPTAAPTDAAIAAVWNGERGLVVVVLREVDPPVVRRFELEAPIGSLEDLESGIALARSFAERLGFDMDEGEFSALDAAEQARRLRVWNTLRKIRRKRRKTLEAVDEPAAVEEKPQAVLGKIALVRRARPSTLARILGYF